MMYCGMHKDCLFVVVIMYWRMFEWLIHYCDGVLKDPNSLLVWYIGGCIEIYNALLVWSIGGCREMTNALLS